MPSPGFTDPAVASIPPAGNLYYGADVALSGSPGLPAQELQGGNMVGNAGTVEYHSTGRSVNLMFGGGTTGSGEAIPMASEAAKGHWTEVFNFHGSPAPWILFGILIVAGLLHVSAGAKGKVEL